MGAAHPGFAAFERAGWTARAAGYDQFLAKVTARVIDHTLDAVAAAAGTRFLDVACGPGDATAAAKARGARALGVDIATAMLDIARRRHRTVDFLAAAAEALPFASGTFDGVVGNFLVHHLADPHRTGRELARVLASGARLALTAWDEPARARLVGVLVDAIAEVGAPPPPDLPVGPPFFRYSTAEAMTALLEGCGLRDVEVHTVAFAHPVADAATLWQGLLGGTVRTSALVLRQPDDVQRRIRAAFDRLAGHYADGPRLSMPVSVRLAVGRR